MIIELLQTLLMEDQDSQTCAKCTFLLVRSHTFSFQSTELYVGTDPYRKGSITGN